MIGIARIRICPPGAEAMPVKTTTSVSIITGALNSATATDGSSVTLNFNRAPIMRCLRRLRRIKAAAIPVSIMALFLTYWILPNRRVPVRRILPVAVMVGPGLEVLKYAFLRACLWLSHKFENEYYPFQQSVSIIVLAW